MRRSTFRYSKGTVLDVDGGFFQRLLGSEGPEPCLNNSGLWQSFTSQKHKGLGDPILQAAFDYLKLLIDPQLCCIAPSHPHKSC